MKSKELKNVTDNEARKTALVVAIVSILAAVFFGFRGRATAAFIAVIIAALLTVIGFFIPKLAKIFHRVWMRFAFVLGYINSRILLSLIYFFIFVPYGIISRLFGRDPLQIRGQSRETYWHPRAVTRQAKEQFERLF